MTLKAGLVIKSTNALDNTYFESATIILTTCNSNDAIGFIINRPMGRNLNMLEEFKQSLPFALYEGGPVDQEHLYFIHRQPASITGGTHIDANLYFGGNFKQVIQCINSKSATASELKIFTGYCGWDTEQLLEEIEEGSWLILENENVFEV